MGASQTSPSSIVWSVEVSVEGVYRDTVLKLELRLSLARAEREKPRRCIEAETVAWSSKQFGEVSCSLDNDELVEACVASLLQSIEEEQLRLSQVPRSDAGYELLQLAWRRVLRPSEETPCSKRRFRWFALVTPCGEFSKSRGREDAQLIQSIQPNSTIAPIFCVLQKMTNRSIKCNL